MAREADRREMWSTDQSQKPELNETTSFHISKTLASNTNQWPDTVPELHLLWCNVHGLIQDTETAGGQIKKWAVQHLPSLQMS